MLWLLAITLIISWESEGCPAGYLLMQGTPVPEPSAGYKEVLSVVKQLPEGCSTTVEVPPGSYIFALQVQDVETGELGEESDRCSVVVNPDNETINTNCPDEVPSSLPIPVFLRVP